MIWAFTLPIYFPGIIITRSYIPIPITILIQAQVILKIWTCRSLLDNFIMLFLKKFGQMNFLKVMWSLIDIRMKGRLFHELNFYLSLFFTRNFDACASTFKAYKVICEIKKLLN